MAHNQFSPRQSAFNGSAEGNGDRPIQVWDLVGACGPDVTRLGLASETLMPGIAGVSVSAGTALTGPEVRFTSDETSSRIEDLQHTMDEGPCRDAASRQRPVVAADLTTGPWRQRWPRFTPAALDAGARAVFALPLHAGGVRHEGAVDLYRRSPGGLDGTERTAALAFAAAAAELITLEEFNLDWSDAFARGSFEQTRGESPTAVCSPAPGAAAALLACWFDATTLPEVRGQVRDASSREGLSGVDLYQFVLAVHEAMTNVVRHGGGHGQLLLWCSAETLWCEVTDHGPGIPESSLPARRPGGARPDHHGLWLIRRTCTSCRVTTDGTGTRLLLGYRLNAAADSTPV
jgi:anti-sigma regulatory factor (Ser/Thr protein kinase)